MVKSIGNLWPQLTAWQNLLDAYRTCRRRKRYRQPATEFEFRWEQNLLQLQRELLTGEYQHGRYYHFRISDPKPRTISAAPFRDRVVHHALVSVLEPVFERSFVFDSYACRVGKGTHRAIRRAQHFQRQFPWCLSTDIVKFFPNIDHEVLLSIIRRRVRDVNVVALVETILSSSLGEQPDEVLPQWFPGDDLLAALRPRGLPIGNLTSQFFANVYLDPVDHFIKESLQLPGYIRYADDLLLFGSSRKELWDAVDRLRARLMDCRLKLHPHKTHLQLTSQPMTWLGFQVSANQIRVSQQGIRRFIHRVKRQRHEFQTGKLDLNSIPISLKAWQAHLEMANSSQLQRTLIRKHLRFRK